MILQRLPNPALASNINSLPVFADHCLFTEEVHCNYEYPEHISGLGILAAFNGNGNFYINGSRNTLGAQNYFVINSGSKLAINIRKENTRPVLLFFHSYLQNAVAESITQSHEKLLDGKANLSFADVAMLERMHNTTPALLSRIQQMIALGSSCASFHALKADILARNILEELMLENKRSLQLSMNLAVIKHATRIELYKRLSLAKEWMEAHYASAILLADIAKTAMLNSQHFLRLFKQVYKQTPHQYLMEFRLQKAREILISSGQPIAEICNLTGFESVTSFSNLFRQKFGVSPGMYRRGAL
ncbi:MAG: AraC family transcriptional regulator [Chitinophagaceae bacterium]|nr:AraC family transcriptional regulator [Chitinophagaceae bacterium]